LGEQAITVAFSDVLPQNAEMSENPITDSGTMIRWTIQFPEDDLEKLADLQRRSRINGREWMRALLAALVEYHELTGSVTLPLAVVPRGEAERAGLLPPQEKRTSANQR
jgi:hypothetical protein